MVKLGGQVQVEHFENCLATTQISHQNFVQTFCSSFSTVSEPPDFKGSVCYEAQKLSKNLRKFETISMVFTFIRIFDITTLVSDYLQTSGLDIMQAWHMINNATKNVEKISRELSDIFETAFSFVVRANLKLKEVSISVPKSFSIIRSSRSAPEVSLTRRQILKFYSIMR